MCAQTQVSVCRVVRFKFRRITIMNDASSMEKQQLIDIRRSLYLLWQFFFPVLKTKEIAFSTHQLSSAYCSTPTNTVVLVVCNIDKIYY